MVGRFLEHGLVLAFLLRPLVLVGLRAVRVLDHFDLNCADG